MLFKLLAGLILIAGLIFVLNRFLLYMESRGWIYYRKKKPGSGALSSACIEIQQMLEPSKKYVVQVRKNEKRTQQEAGDLPPGFEDISSCSKKEDNI